ncbi:hypothetical protein [Actibacterium atlanticum]|uniref:hypothetical protein n=1 Tax=Actibacterium atlanticum TaxID=1461693 RepID=UPI0012DCD6A9|nr:hypothetical protein [Actibacterium atlanticum]
MTLSALSLMVALLSGLSAFTVYDLRIARRRQDTLALAILSTGAMMTMAALQDHASVPF